jgi:hypothetical protein
MSLDVMTAVWKHSDAKGTDLLLLLALADNADDEGFCFPSYPYLAAKTRMSDRTVRRRISELCDTDELSLVASGRAGRSNEYMVNIHALREKPDHTPKRGGQNDRVAERSTGQNDTPYGQQVAASTVIPNHQEKDTVAGATDSTSEDTEAGTLFPQPAAVPDKPKDTTAQDRETIWAHYVATFDPPRKELTPSRVKLIDRALKECALMEDRVDYLKSAITGLSVWRQQRPGDTALSAVFQTRPGGSTLGDQLQFFVDQATSGGTSARPKVPSVLSGTISARKREVVDMLAYPDSPDHKQRGLAAVEWLKAEVGTEPIIEDGQLQGWREVEKAA